MNTLLYKKLELLGCLCCMVTILGVCKGLHLITDVICVSKATEVPSCVLHDWELPAMVPKVVRSLSLEELTVGDDRADPRLPC